MKQKQKGSGLIFAVVLLFVILGMVITLSSITVLETKMSQKTKSSIGAFYGAESGVEWALNKIATSSGPKISNAFGSIGSDHTVSSPSNPDYKVYLLDKSGNVIIADDLISNVKAVRSVGTQGGETQRAIEAAVASGGGGCYIDYSFTTFLAVGSPCKVSGFTNKGSAGKWGFCFNCGDIGCPSAFLPAGGSCAFGNTIEKGDAYLCCM